MSDILESTGAANIPGLRLTWVRAVILNLESVTLQYSSRGGDPPSHTILFIAISQLL